MNPLRWRRATWIALLFVVVMGTWVAGAVGNDTAVCDDLSAGSAEDAACRAGDDIEDGVGVGLLVVAWAAGTVLCAGLWAVSRPERRAARRGEGGPDGDRGSG